MLIRLDHFLALVEAYGRATKLAEATISTKVLNDGGRIKDIREGRSDIGTRRLERAIEWFSANWPDAAVWPTAIPRPETIGGGRPQEARVAP